MLKEGTIVEAPFWSEPVELKKVVEKSVGFHLIGSTLNSGQHVDVIIPHEDLEKIRIKDFTLSFTGDGEELFLCLESIRFSHASLFDPFLAMNVSKIDPLPFQIEAVYGYVLKLPKVRFLIADDPGAGKTIMAGLIIKELKLRGVIKRILIVVPGHLKDQWRRELQERFQEPFTLIGRQVMDAHYGENVWERENQIITSIDFAKQEEILHTLANVQWDLVVIDEAHKMAAYRYGIKTSKTDRYRLGEVLSKNTKHLLFLTATPHKGDPENYRLFLDLLEPGFFATKNMVKESIERGENPLFIRRLKEDLKDFDGRPIFTNRYALTLKFRLSDKEKVLYNKLSDYVVSQYNKAIQKISHKGVAFALLILQRRLASSTYALYKSLERRKEKLKRLLKESELKVKSPFFEMEDYEDFEEEERWKKESEWESLSLSETKEELNREISIIDELISLASEIITNEEEVKLQELKKAIEEGFKKIEELQGNKKILIFTESKDTMEYLVNKIKSWGYRVNYIHGGMGLEERIEAEKVFKNETEVMVATEAAGEGINLQFCHIMINYDIPWNPNRLEQRMGRIHRYGQKKDVYMFNIVTEDTREGEVFKKLFDKIEEIKNSLGTDKVFDIIGDIFYGKNLYQLIIEAVTQAKTIDEIIREIDIVVDSDYIQRIKEILGESLATRNIDYTRLRETAEKAKEFRLIPEYVEEFFKKAFLKAGGKYRIKKDGFLSIENIPYEIKNIAKSIFGPIASFYPKVTFDKEIAFRNPDSEFISFGHPLFEALIHWIREKYFENLKRGAVFEDPEGRLKGYIFFYEGEVKDGKGETAGKSIIALYDNGRDIKPVNPALLWDLVPKKFDATLNMNFNREKLEEEAYLAVRNYKEEILKERKRQAEIKAKYGLRSLDHLIQELDLDLVDLSYRLDRGEKVESVKARKEERKKYYENSKLQLQRDIERETHLTVSSPKFIGAVFVKSETGAPTEEVEKVGMKIAMDYEKSCGRIPEDVSGENLGYDIRSKGKSEIRYIEVKARADTGDIVLTPNEWFKARRFKEDYWLYIVENALKKPILYVIQNPFGSLNVTEKVEVVRIFVSQNEWKEKGEKVNE